MDPGKIGAALREHRERKNISQPDLAEALGVSQSAVSRAELGDFKRFQAWMLQAAAYLGFEFDPEIVKDDEGGAGESKQFAKIAAPGVLVNSQNFPVYSSSTTNDGSLVVSGDPVDYAPMPSFLTNVKDSYGLIIADDAMKPEFRIGDTALVHPHLPPMPDEPCVFRESRHGGRALVRTFVRETATHWIVSQHNPKRQDKLPKSAWPMCHRTVGRYSRR